MIDARLTRIEDQTARIMVSLEQKKKGLIFVSLNKHTQYIGDKTALSRETYKSVQKFSEHRFSFLKCL